MTCRLFYLFPDLNKCCHASHAAAMILQSGSAEQQTRKGNHIAPRMQLEEDVKYNGINYAWIIMGYWGHVLPVTMCGLDLEGLAFGSSPPCKHRACIYALPRWNIKQKIRSYWVFRGAALSSCQQVIQLESSQHLSLSEERGELTYVNRQR